MKVLDLKDVVRKDVPLYYRRLFSGTAVMEICNEQLEKRVEFTIETKPTGSKDISVVVLEPVEYPLVPILRELRNTVSLMDKSGVLP